VTCPWPYPYLNRGWTWTDLLPNRKDALTSGTPQDQPLSQEPGQRKALKPLNDREREIAATFYAIGFSDAVDILSEPCEPPAGGEETKEVVQ
jgi:hypothetical protein